MQQLEISLAPREIGREMAERCESKAVRVASFDSDGVRKFIVGYLVRFGPQSGEALVKAAKDHGYRGHDDRCFGPIFHKLARDKAIVCLRSDLPRERGHGTSGGKLWSAA
jgi:hypothetical protein